jgi:hypothetical protein
MTTTAPATRDVLAALTDTPARRLLRRLAEQEATELPVLNVALDLRPEATGDRPALGEAKVRLRDRLREHEATLEPHSAAHDSFTADQERIWKLLEDEYPPQVEGSLIWACAGAGLWEHFETRFPLETAISVGDQPDLVALSRIADHEPALVAEVDSNTLRLFHLTNGGAEELPGHDEDHHDYLRDDAEERQESKIQAHEDAHAKRFAKTAAARIDRELQRRDARRILLAGDDVGVPLLKGHLSPHALGRVGEVLHLPVRGEVSVVREHALPVLERLEAEDAHDAADRMLGAARGDGMGLVGLPEVRLAFLRGQVLELLLDGGDTVEPDVVRELVRSAATTDAAITFVQDHAGLTSEGGVGALLRFRVGDEGSQAPA